MDGNGIKMSLKRKEQYKKWLENNKEKMEKYRKNYYKNNKEGIIKKLCEDSYIKNKLLHKARRLAALKAWVTRVEEGFYIKDKDMKLKRWNKEIKELERQEKKNEV